MPSILSQIKLLVVFMSRILDRIFCCFKRKRKTDDDDNVIMDSIIVTGSKREQDDGLTSWSNWNDEPKISPLEQKIQQYRNTLARPPDTEKEEEPEPDYFDGMMPRLTRPKQLVFKATETASQPAPFPSRLALRDESSTLQTSELGEWPEENTGGWLEVEDPDLDSVLQEQKRVQRQQRLQEQLKKKQEKQGKKVLATKLT